MLMLLLFLNLEIFGIFLIFLILLENLFMDEEFYFYYKMMDLNFWMLLLIYIMYLMMLMSEISYKMSLNFLFLSLLFIMMSSDLIMFFLFYEMVFILIMFTIILLGYNYERLMAAFLMMFYSFLFSSPIMMMILVFDYSFLMKEWLFYSIMINYFFIGSFMVKFPIFGFHYWLPVAHVEASTIGSMLLAGVLLKLGSMGIIYIIMYMNFMMKFHWLSISISILMLMILSLSDLKIMIAYSSIAHMSMVFYILMLGSYISKKGALLMMFYHGFISPLMFWVVGMLMWMKTRSLLVVKLLSFSYIMILCLFFLFILNMGFPPFMGFLSEILMYKSLISNYMIMLIFSLSILLSCYYNVYLFWCFNSFMGIVFKVNFFFIDLFLFLILSLLLNLF